MEPAQNVSGNENPSYYIQSTTLGSSAGPSWQTSLRRQASVTV